jgi:hypothetical protein
MHALFGCGAHHRGHALIHRRVRRARADDLLHDVLAQMLEVAVSQLRATARPGLHLLGDDAPGGDLVAERGKGGRDTARQRSARNKAEHERVLEHGSNGRPAQPPRTSGDTSRGYRGTTHAPRRGAGASDAGTERHPPAILAAIVA